MLRTSIAILTMLAAGAAAWAQARGFAIPARTTGLRSAKADDKAKIIVRYNFTPDAAQAEFLTSAEQAARRGKEAAEAWKIFPKAERAVAVVALAPYGGGECAKSYWPPGIRPELLKDLAEPLARAGIKVAMPEFPDFAASASQPATGAAGGSGAPKVDSPEDIMAQIRRLDQEKADPSAGTASPGAGTVKLPPKSAGPPKPWPKLGMPDPEDYPFVLLVGLHHEIVPYEGVRRLEEDKVVYSRASRVNAWAILFYTPTGTACWGTTAVARVGHKVSDDPMNQAAEMALGYLDFTNLGSDNIPEAVTMMKDARELPSLDLACMLVQTQRADALEAACKSATGAFDYKVLAHVLRLYSQAGTPQDYRIATPEYDPKNKTLVSQRVPVRFLLLEQIRGVRSVAASAMAAVVPKAEDFELGPIGKQYVGVLEPLSPEDEIVLIAELATQDVQQIFTQNMVRAVTNLGKCRTHVELASDVARYYAERPQPPTPPGRRPQVDPLKEAGRQAVKMLSDYKLQREAKRAGN